MKMLALTFRHAKKTAVMLGWQRQLFFADPAPAVDRLVTIEIPEVKYHEDGVKLYRDIVRHLSGGKGSARETVQLPSDLWRPAVLDDLLDADNGEHHMHSLASQFTSDQLGEFVVRTTPEIAERVRRVMEVSGGQRRSRFKKERRFVATSSGAVLWGLPQRLEIEREREREAQDRARLKALPDDASPEATVRLVSEMKTDKGVRLALRRFANRFLPRGVAWEDAEPALARLSRSKRAREALEYDRDFWERIGKNVHLPPSVTGETFDLSTAREVVVRLGFDLLDAKRVGVIVPGRTALVVRNAKHRATLLVRGERRLLQRIQASADGRLERYGCVLTIPNRKESALRRLLLDTERIDTLAAVAPDAAVAVVEAAGPLADDHPVRAAADAARTDFRQARALSDLLIEELCGVDADVLRAMARAQARRGRR